MLTCHICKQPIDPSEESKDHLIPKTFGGSSSAANIRLAHKRCNSARQHYMTLSDLVEASRHSPLTMYNVPPRPKFTVKTLCLMARVLTNKKMGVLKKQTLNMTYHR